jgi:hypothetical protein
LRNITENETEWATKLSAGTIVDTRNWELMPSIGGNRQNLQDQSHLKLIDDSPEGIMMKIEVERALDMFMNGGEVKLPAAGNIQLEKVSRHLGKRGREIAEGVLYGFRSSRDCKVY